MSARRPNVRNRSSLDRFAPLGVAVAAGSFQLPFFDRTMSVLDEGHILMFADIVANGGELYRDATLAPLPGAFYLLALAFEVFGPSILVARWILLIEFSLFCAFGFAILRRVASTRAAWIGIGVLFVYRVWAFPHWHMYSYSTTSLCLLAAGLVCLLRHLESEDRRWLGAAGLAAGLAVFCKQDYGVGGLVALNLVAIVKCATDPDRSRGSMRRALAWLNGPAVAVGALTAVHFLRQGLFGEMLQQTLMYHLIGISSFDYSSLPPLRPIFGQTELIRTPYGFGAYTPAILLLVDWGRVTSSWLYTDTPLWDLAVKVFFYGPYLFLAFGGIRLWRARSRLRSPSQRLEYLNEFALYALAVLLLAVLNKPVDYVHVVVLIWPLLLLAVVYVRAFTRHRPNLAGPTTALGLLAFLAVAAHSTFLLAKLIEANDTPLRGERAGVRVLATEDRVIGGAVDYVRANSSSDQPVAVLPYYPLISFLADRRSPHRAAYTFWPVEYIPGVERQIIDAMEAANSQFLIYHFTQFAQFPRMEEFAPDLFAYLVETYDIDRVFSDPHWGMMLAGLKRGDAAADGIPIFAPDGRNGLASIERGDGTRETLPAERREEIVQAALWPFRPVLALRPLSGGRRSVLSIDVEVPPGSRLRCEVGVHPKAWFQVPPARVTFTVTAVADGERSLLATRTLDPHADYRDRHWFGIDVDLGPFTGRRIELEFGTATDRSEGERFEMGGLATPRLVTP